MVCKDGIILGTEKIVVNKMMINEKNMEIHGSEQAEKAVQARRTAVGSTQLRQLM